MLLEAVWDFHFDPRTNIVETHVSRLRAKLAQFGGPELIHTVGGNDEETMNFIVRHIATVGISALILAATSSVSRAACNINGDANPVHNFNDNSEAVSFNIDVGYDAFGSIYDGSIACSGPVTVVSEQHLDGGCAYSSSVNGAIYTWHIRCGKFGVIHDLIRLSYGSSTNVAVTRGHVAKIK